MEKKNEINLTNEVEMLMESFSHVHKITYPMAGEILARFLQTNHGLIMNRMGSIKDLLLTK